MSSVRWVAVEMNLGHEPENVYGPFASESEAEEWANRHQAVAVMRLWTPSEYEDTTGWASPVRLVESRPATADELAFALEANANYPPLDDSTMGAR